jgi:hypothetical protein
VPCVCLTLAPSSFRLTAGSPYPATIRSMTWAKTASRLTVFSETRYFSASWAAVLFKESL